MIGLVGAGGIGLRLKAVHPNFDWESVSAIIVLFIIVVFVIDRLSTLAAPAAGVSDDGHVRCTRTACPGEALRRR